MGERREVKISLRVNRKEYEMIQYIMRETGADNKNEAIRWAIRQAYLFLKGRGERTVERDA